MRPFLLSCPANQVAPWPAGEFVGAASAGPVAAPTSETASAEATTAVPARRTNESVDMLSFPLRQRAGAPGRGRNPPAAFLDSVCSGRVVSGAPARRVPREGHDLRLRVSAGVRPASPATGVTGCDHSAGY